MDVREVSGGELLFEQFPSVSREAWEEVIERDLKGGDRTKRLVWRPLEGFTVEPYYRSDDLERIPNRDINPGEYPYIRGNHKDSNPWYIREEVIVSDAGSANARALDALNRGADSLGFVLPFGKPLNAVFFRELLAEIEPGAAEVNFIAPGFGHRIFSALSEAFSSLGEKWEGVHGAVEYSPLSEWLRSGRCPNGSEVELWSGVEAAVNFAQRYPGMRTLCVDATVFHNGGSTAVQDLGFALSQAMEYVERMKERGVRPELVAGSLRFKFSIGSTYFMELSKLRAVRGLWSRSLEAYGIKSGPCTQMEIHAETSQWNQTVYDPYVNLLRASTEGMSAVLAGVHSLRVMPFDSVYASPNEFSGRLARNLQLLLRDEAYFDKVVDPGGGSYYIETLTYELARHAWDLFLECEKGGGFTACMKSGMIQDRIGAVGADRRKRIATRRDTLLGTNQFPNFGEVMEVEVRDAMDRYFSAKDSERSSGGDELGVRPLSAFRGAEDFERLRMATDRMSRRPRAFMLALGNLAMRRARAQFSCNFLSCAGIEVIDNIGFGSIEEGLAAAREQKSDIIVLCSSDDEYADLGPATYALIDKEGELFIIAGAPACQADLEAVGIEHFISVRSNLLETLRGFLSKLEGSVA